MAAIKVLHIYKTFPPDSYGGVEHFIYDLAKTTELTGVSNTILTVSRDPHQSNHIFPFNVKRKKITFTKASCPVSLSLFFSFKKLIAAADIIHFHFPWPYAETLLALFGKKNQKTVVTYHSDIVKQKYLKFFYQPLMNLFLKRVNKIIVTSENLLNSSKDLARFQHKCEIIPLGIESNLKDKADSQKVLEWRNQLGEKFLLFIGQFRYYKGLDILLQAIQGLSIKTVLIGCGQQQTALKQLAENLQLNNIYFTGALAHQDKLALLELCHAVILPSTYRSEAFGISLIEGAAFGKPLISTDLGTGTNFVNLNGITGLVVEPKQVLPLREAIMKLFSDQALAQQYGQASFARFNDHFTIEHIAEKYSLCYQKLLEITN